MPKSSRKRKKSKRKPLPPAERAFRKIQKDHQAAIRSVFRAAGFIRATGVSNKEFCYKHQTSDIDDLFVLENVVIVVEYTCTKSSLVGDHLKIKKLIFDKMKESNHEFVEFILDRFPASDLGRLLAPYHLSQLEIRIVYCSRYDFDAKYKLNITAPIYMDYPCVRYFLSISEAIKRSCRYELLYFLKVDPQSFGSLGKITATITSKDYRGMILPEAHSNFSKGYKVVSFYVDPEALLKTAYVLRKDGWRDSQNLYQRMISKKKIESIRSFLKNQKRVFINDIVVTLPDDVKPVDGVQKTLDFAKLTTTSPVTIKLPDRPKSIGIIDGQHRVFAYHETASDDPDIAKLRVQQNLLVTGIICPSNLSPFEREKFEARLFLEINSTQASAKSQLKQAIGLVLNPFSSDSIATRVLGHLARQGPLAGWVAQYFFDTDKLKTASIVSFGLKPLVKSGGTDSLFAIWPHPDKDRLILANDNSLLNTYIEFCASSISTMFISIRKNVALDRWVTNPKKKDRILTTTHINGFLISIRYLIENKRSLKSSRLEAGLKNLNNFNFSEYHSSQYNRLAQRLVAVHFGIKSNS